jgi:hypothetical protein
VSGRYAWMPCREGHLSSEKTCDAKSQWVESGLSDTCVTVNCVQGLAGQDGERTTVARTGRGRRSRGRGQGFGAWRWITRHSAAACSPGGLALPPSFPVSSAAPGSRGVGGCAPPQSCNAKMQFALLLVALSADPAFVMALSTQAFTGQ